MKVETRPPNAPLRVAFIMEQALGHATHYANVRQFTDTQADIAPVWLPIPYGVEGPSRLVPLIRSNWSVRASWRARRALDSLLARQAVDALFFHTQVTSLFSAGLMRHLPTVLSLDATPINYDSLGEHYGHRPSGSGFVDRKKFQLNRHAFHAARGLVAWSEWARRSLIDDYGVDGSRVRVVPPGAQPSFFRVGQRRAGMPTPTPGPRVRLLFVGGDFQRKGGPLLLEVMRGPLGERCELHLVTHADVPPQPNVILHRGLQANSPELLRLFAEADLFVLPTYADCLAMVLEEAAAAGLPVITTNVGPLSESVEQSGSGIALAPGNAKALQEALSELVDNPHERRRMGQAGYAQACRLFNADHNTRAVLEFVADMVATRPASRRAA